MSKDEEISKLSKENLAFKKKNELLEFEIANLKRLIFGSKTERFVVNEIAANQGFLFVKNTEGKAEEDSEEKEKEKNAIEKIFYERKKSKTSKGKHQGRNKIPEHLPTYEVIIEPEEDTTGIKKIGEENHRDVGIHTS